jgi:predicted chitinase
MAKKKSYDAYLRQQIGDLIDQLELPALHKHSLKERWLDQMIWADKKAAQCRRSYYRLRLITIIGGVLLPALVGISVQLGQSTPFVQAWFPPLTFLLSQVIAVSVAIEEFCKFGERWRDYRKMSEELKSEGWQYLQCSGPYEYGINSGTEAFQTHGQRSTLLENGNRDRFSSLASRLQLDEAPKQRNTHLQNYTQFANRVESIIRDDVQGYISDLIQQQARQDAEAQKALAQAQAAADNKTLIAQLGQSVQAWTAPPSPPVGAAPITVAPGLLNAPAAPTIGAAGTLSVQQDTAFKLSAQPSQALPESQKVTIRRGTTFGLMACTIAENNHYQVTLTQGLDATNGNTWFVYAPHVEILDRNGHPTTPAPLTPPAPLIPAKPAPAAIGANGPIKLAVPYYSQIDNMAEAERTCNTSSCAMVAKFLGAKISGDDDYYHYVTKYGDTTDHNVQTQALNELGIKSTWNTNLDFEDLDKSLAAGLPIVVGILHHGSLEAPDPNSGHMLVVIGRTAQGDYIVNDPYGSVLDNYTTTDGKELIYSRYVLTCRWTCNGKGSGWGRLFYGNASPAVPASPTVTAQVSSWTPPANATLPIGNKASAKLTAVAVNATRNATLITVEQLLQIAGSNAPKARLRDLAPVINQTLEQYQINTPLRIAHFIAQVAHESACFNAMEEYASGVAYENREDLGNTEPGDGVRFKGRGLMQLTGRSNYMDFSRAMNQDFMAQPELVAQLPYAVLVAGWFWETKNLNPLADQDDVVAITQVINGGSTGLEERKAYLQAARAVLNC